MITAEYPAGKIVQMHERGAIGERESAHDFERRALSALSQNSPSRNFMPLKAEPKLTIDGRRSDLLGEMMDVIGMQSLFGR